MIYFRRSLFFGLRRVYLKSKEVRLQQFHFAFAAALALGVPLAISAQQPAAQAKAPRVAPEDNRPPLAFRGEWKRPAEEGNHTIGQADLTNQNLELKLYGDKEHVNETLHAIPKTEGTYIWTGLCEASCAVALRDKANYVDLSDPMAKIRWKSKQAGFHLLRPLVKLADGTWLVAEYGDGYTPDWRESDIPLAGMRWRQFDSKTALTTGNGQWIVRPDLSKVDEIGFTDLMAGAGHGAGGSSRVSWIEVYGKPVKRESK